jgi:hypothetical protein
VEEGYTNCTFIVVLQIPPTSQLAEAENHHPDLSIKSYRNVVLELSTHAGSYAILFLSFFAFVLPSTLFVSYVVFSSF